MRVWWVGGRRERERLLRLGTSVISIAAVSRSNWRSVCCRFPVFIVCPIAPRATVTPCIAVARVWVAPMVFMFADSASRRCFMFSSRSTCTRCRTVSFAKSRARATFPASAAWRTCWILPCSVCDMRRRSLSSVRTARPIVRRCCRSCSRGVSGSPKSDASMAAMLGRLSLCYSINQRAWGIYWCALRARTLGQLSGAFAARLYLYTAYHTV